MLAGRAHWHWYDIPLLALAFVIVFPDAALDWLGGVTGKSFSWLHVLVLELVAMGGILVLTLYLMPIYPKLEWWYPVLYVGVLAAVRLIRRVLVSMFDFGD